MVFALNLTAPLKQDATSQERLERLVMGFTDELQPLIQAVLARSGIVHFARLLVIGEGKYLQVITEFDGAPFDYAEFFRTELGPVFEVIFSLVEGAPPWEELNAPGAFAEFTHSLNVKALGTSTIGTEGRGYLFSAFGDATVRELKARVGSTWGSLDQT
jgi:hypothetical protein